MNRKPGDYFEFQYQNKMSWDECKAFVTRGGNYRELAAKLGISTRRAFDWWHKARKELESEHV